MNETAVRELFEQEFGTTLESVTEYQDGVNTVYNVSANDDSAVVKFGTFDPSSVRVEPYVLRWLNGRGLPTPAVHHVGEWSSVPFFVMDELNGEQYRYPSELSIEELVSLSRTIGSLLGKAHATEIGVGKLVVSDNALAAEDQEWSAFFKGYLERFVGQAKQNYPHLGSEAARLAHWAMIPKVDGGFFCPLDMHTRNLFMHDGEVAGVMDFERCYGGHSGWGYATTRHTLQAGRSDDVADRVGAAFKEGYEQERQKPSVSPVFDLAAVLREMRAAHMWWDDPQEHEERLQATLDAIESRIKSGE